LTALFRDQRTERIRSWHGTADAFADHRQAAPTPPIMAISTSCKPGRGFRVIDLVGQAACLEDDPRESPCVLELLLAEIETRESLRHDAKIRLYVVSVV